MILRLAHVEVGVGDLAAARAFYVDLLGFVEHAGDATSAHLRCAEEFDLWSLKLTAGPAGLVHSGFRVSDAADLDELRGAARAGSASPRSACPPAPSSARGRRCAC